MLGLSFIIIDTAITTHKGMIWISTTN